MLAALSGAIKCVVFHVATRYHHPLPAGLLLRDHLLAWGLIPAATRLGAAKPHTEEVEEGFLSTRS